MQMSSIGSHTVHGSPHGRTSPALADDGMLVIGKTELAGIVPPDKLEACIRMFAASTRHLSGAKLVTSGTAAIMDITALRQMKSTLKDLIQARSEVRLLFIRGEPVQIFIDVAAYRGSS